MNAAATTGDTPEPAETAVVAKADGGVDGDGSSGSSEAAADGAVAAEDVSPAPKQSRHERKARKILSKLGLTPSKRDMNAVATTGDVPERAETAVVVKGDSDGSSGSSEAAADGAVVEDVSPAPKQPRHKRKARKILSKLGLTPSKRDMNSAATTGDAPELAEMAVVAKADGGGDDDGGSSSGSSEAAADGASAEDVSPALKQSRQERKARKILSKLGLTPIPGVKRVVIRKTDDSMFVITNAEVFKNPKSDSYIVFGDWQVQDLNRRAQSDAARMFQLPTLPQNTPIIRPIMMTPMMYDQIYGQIDYMGVDEKDVELICEQLEVDKFTAIDSLRRNNNDIVNAIMELTQP